MSVIGGIVPLPSPAEIAAGGNVVPLRKESPPVDQTGAEPASALGPVSPELAMVDPELRQAALELLPDLPRPVPQPVAVERPVVVPLPSTLAPVPELAPPRRRSRLGLLASAAGVVALGVLLTLVVGREEQPSQRARQTQSVAAAVSPTTATVTQPEPTATTPAKPPPTATTPAKSPPAATTPATSKPAHASAVQGQTFVWVTSPDAAAYEFQLFQGGERIFRARVDDAKLELPGRWRQAGRPHALLPGELPLVRVDDRQRHESAGKEADRERKARGRRAAAVVLARQDHISS